MINNIDKSKVTTLVSEVTCQKGQVVSKTLTKSTKTNISLFAFDINEGLSTHSSTGDALVNVLEGEAKITIDGVEFVVQAGQSILMPANIPHALFATTAFKMLLIIVFKD